MRRPRAASSFPRALPLDLDFTSPFYLGLQHASSELRSWDFLFPNERQQQHSAYSSLEYQLARLQGCESAALAPSTLHVFIGLFGILGKLPIHIYVDEGVYPITRWGVAHAASLGARSTYFRHNDPNDLESKVSAQTDQGRPVVVADSVCTGCGEVAPVGEYLREVRKHDGLLVLDDTQGLGILGELPGQSCPYGRGGGGILRWSGASGEDVMIVSSLGKAFGVPVAALSGSEEKVELYKTQSDSIRYCSPPCLPAVRAAEHALDLNANRGDSIRVKLCQNVRHFRLKMGSIGFLTSGGLLPVQSLRGKKDYCERLHESLMSVRIRVKLFDVAGHESRLVFLLTAVHADEQIDLLVEALARQLGKAVS